MSSFTVDDPGDFFLSMAVFSAFMDKGMRGSPLFQTLAVDRLREGALVENAASLVPLAVRLERAILALDGATPVLGRTFEQDVCAPFGAWFIQHCTDHGGHADERVCRDRIANAVIEYFSFGQTPAHAWAVARAVKAVDPMLRLSAAVVVGSLNWEWVPRVANAGVYRDRDEHPRYSRTAWQAQHGPVHISGYWPWVEHQVKAGYVTSRYDALSAMPNLFLELVMAGEVFVDDTRLLNLKVRRDLAAQEGIEALPAHTAFSAGLFAALPELHRAFGSMDADFCLEPWIARPVSDFMSEFARATDPETTPIIAGRSCMQDGQVPFVCMLDALWNAVPEGGCNWRLEDGAILTVRVDGHAVSAASAPAVLSVA